MNSMRVVWFLQVGFWFVFAMACVSFLHPITNPDLFWHLAAARQAENLGKLFLDTEFFSFTLAGEPWINYEWLFERLVYALFKLGDFRSLVFLQTALLAATVLALDRYVIFVLRAQAQPLSGAAVALMRTANLAIVSVFLMARSSLQPELFTLFFLIVFFYWRDRWLREGLTSWWILILISVFFSLWANIHGGFILALGILGLEFLASSATFANIRHPGNELKVVKNRLLNLVLLGCVGFLGSLINPFGVSLYEAIFQHAKDAPMIAEVIKEWEPAQLYDLGSWMYWSLFVLAAAFLASNSRQARSLATADIFLVVAFGFFASGHVRNIALFGVVSLPILWRHMAALWSRQKSPLWPKAGVFVLAAASLIYLGGRFYQSAETLYRARGVPRDYVSGGRYPSFAVNFIEKNPALAQLRTLAEWGWGGFVEWRLAPLGLKVYFDGRYLFHHLLHEMMLAAQHPKEWDRRVKEQGIELMLLNYPEDFKPVRTANNKGGYAFLPRSWHSQAIDLNHWALVWWDAASLLFVDRQKVSPDWLKEHEYKIPLPFDPYWVEFQVQSGRLALGDVFKELARNAGSAGWNKRNKALWLATLQWKRSQVIK